MYQNKSIMWKLSFKSPISFCPVCSFWFSVTVHHQTKNICSTHTPFVSFSTFSSSGVHASFYQLFLLGCAVFAIRRCSFISCILRLFHNMDWLLCPGVNSYSPASDLPTVHIIWKRRCYTLSLHKLSHHIYFKSWSSNIMKGKRSPTKMTTGIVRETEYG